MSTGRLGELEDFRSDDSQSPDRRSNLSESGGKSKKRGGQQESFGLGNGKMFADKDKKQRRLTKVIQRSSANDMRQRTPCPAPGQASAEHKKRQREGKKPYAPVATSIMKKRKQEDIDDSDEDDPTDLSSYPARATPLKREDDSEQSGQWHDGGNVPKATMKVRGTKPGGGLGRENQHVNRGGREGRGGQRRGKDQGSSTLQRGIPSSRFYDGKGTGKGTKNISIPRKKSLNDHLVNASKKMAGSTESKTGAKEKKPPAVPVVMDLVSDSEDDEETPHVNTDTLLGTDAGKVCHESTEKAGSTVLLGRTWDISRAYLGRRGFGCSNNHPWTSTIDDNRTMRMRVCEDGIILMPEPMAEQSVTEHHAVNNIKNNGSDGFCTIRGQDIGKISFRAVEKTPAKLYYVALHLKTVNLPGFCGCKSLDPHGQGVDDTMKYVTIVLGKDGASADQKKLMKTIQRLCREHSIKFELVGVDRDSMFLRTARASQSERKKWDEEDTKATARAKRSMRRKSEVTSVIGSLESDNNVYLVYPPEEDATNAITITEGDKRRLEPFQYLNDSLIDLKIRHMDLSEEFSHRQGRWYSFNSLFYSRLRGTERMDETYKRVERWTKNIDLFEKELVVVPINEGEHWSVVFLLQPCLLLSWTPSGGADADVNAIVDGKRPGDNRAQSSKETEAAEVEQQGEKAVSSASRKMRPAVLFFDSLGYHSKNKVVKKMCDYLRLEYLSKKHKEAFKEGDLTIKNAAGRIPEYKEFSEAVQNMQKHNVVAPQTRDIPTQQNGYDCGMYVVKYVEWVLRAWPEPTDENISKQFKKVVFPNGSKDFGDSDIDNDRLSFNRLLERLRPDYERERRAAREREVEEKMARRAKKAAVAAAAAATNAGGAGAQSAEGGDGAGKGQEGERERSKTAAGGNSEQGVDSEVVEGLSERGMETESELVDHEVASRTDSEGGS